MNECHDTTQVNSFTENTDHCFNLVCNWLSTLVHVHFTWYHYLSIIQRYSTPYKIAVNYLKKKSIVSYCKFTHYWAVFGKRPKLQASTGLSMKFRVGSWFEWSYWLFEIIFLIWLQFSRWGEGRGESNISEWVSGRCYCSRNALLTFNFTFCLEF